jgi:hypothetical protein
MFYAASAGKTFWFIPSETLYDKRFKAKNEFEASWFIDASASDFKFNLVVGTREIGTIGTITINIRFAKGQMEGVPDARSTYKLKASDWSGLLGAFRK